MRAIIIASVIFISLAFTYDKPIGKDCKCKGIPLYGKVKIVEINPDFRVQVVERNPDLKIIFVDRSPNRCGEWQIVDRAADFTVKIVDRAADFTIKIVDISPGLN